MGAKTFSCGIFIEDNVRSCNSVYQRRRLISELLIRTSEPLFYWYNGLSHGAARACAFNLIRGESGAHLSINGSHVRRPLVSGFARRVGVLMTRVAKVVTVGLVWHTCRSAGARANAGASIWLIALASPNCPEPAHCARTAVWLVVGGCAKTAAFVCIVRRWVASTRSFRYRVSISGASFYVSARCDSTVHLPLVYVT